MVQIRTNLGLIHTKLALPTGLLTTSDALYLDDFPGFFLDFSFNIQVHVSDSQQIRTDIITYARCNN